MAQVQKTVCDQCGKIIERQTVGIIEVDPISIQKYTAERCFYFQPADFCSVDCLIEAIKDDRAWS